MRKQILAVLFVGLAARASTVVDFGGWSQTLAGGEVLTFAPAAFNVPLEGQLIQIPYLVDASTFGSPATIVSGDLAFLLDGIPLTYSFRSQFAPNGGNWTWAFNILTPKQCPPMPSAVDGIHYCLSVSSNVVSGQLGTMNEGSTPASVPAETPEPATFALIGVALVLVSLHYRKQQAGTVHRIGERSR